MSAEIDDLKKDISKLNINLSRVITYLEDNEKTGQPGLVRQFNDLSSSVNDLLTRERVYKAKATTFGIIGGAIVAAAWKIGAFVITYIK